MRAALGLLLSFAAASAQAQSAPRLPRAAFDVIPPTERVLGERGEFRPYQTGCRVGPTEWARRRIVDIAAQEWAAFGFQTIDRTLVETRALPDGLVADALNPALPQPRAGTRYDRTGVSEASARVAADIAGYWTAAPDSARALNRQNEAWNGPGGDAVLWLEPWSAVFISWVMCETGLGDMAQFARDISHRVYIDQAIRARDGASPDAAFVAYDAGEAAINPGDLLCNARGAADYRSLADRRPEMDLYAPTHCDIVVKVDEAGMRILVIGGNVEQSVSLTILPAIRREGRALAPLSGDDLLGARTVFAHLKLQSPDIEADALDRTPSIRALSAAQGN
jgi:hypothetical protein